MTKPRSLRDSALEILKATLAAVDVEQSVRGQLSLFGNKLLVGDESIDLNAYSKVIAIGIGKASVGMGRAVAGVLGHRLETGLIATNALVGEVPPFFEVIIAGHPLPNQSSIEAARKARELLRRHDSESTLVIFMITGGGSALFEEPVDPSITLADLQKVNEALVGCGAVIREMNIVRRHLSSVKGGRLAEAAPKSRQISLYVSDVNEDDLTSVASGPTLPSRATIEDFQQVIDKYALLKTLPPSVIALIQSGRISPLPRPAEDPQRSHHLLLDNRGALTEAKTIAELLDFVVELASDLVEGDVEQLAQTHLERLATLRERNSGRMVCLLSGGEVVCPVRGCGRGGRNQEFVLRAALALDLQTGAEVVVLSAGTDGIDGNSPAAGAIADATTIPSAEAKGLVPADYLNNSDSYTFFAAVGGAIVTGPTGNNVRDLRVLLRQ